jgi:polar amino acid transport system substrate-binding protein
MRALLVGLVAICLVGSACGGADRGVASPTADPTKDKLSQILARGTLVLFTDPEYPPQSFTPEGATRSPDTRCAGNQLTAGEIAGYDADTGKAVAEAIGVEPCFVTPTWTQVTAGNWGDRWDLAYGSGAIAADRMEVLYMTQPYYATPANFFVPIRSAAKEPQDLSGKAVGACAGCTMEDYLRGTLDLPGPPIGFVVDAGKIVTYDTEVPGLKATAKGSIDGFLCSEPVGAEQIAEGLDLRMLATPAYVSYKTGYVDRSSGLNVASFIEKVNEIIAGLHADGTLPALSEQYFGKDYATLASEFDIGSIGQTVT